MNLDIKQFNFLSILTAIVVMSYVGVAVFAFFEGTLTWSEFTGAVGTQSGLLLGYWLRGKDVTEQ